MKVAFISSKNVQDKMKLSGTAAYIVHAIKKYIGQVDIVDNITPQRSMEYIINNFGFFCVSGFLFIIQKIANICGRNFYWERTLFISYYYSRAILRKIENKEYDFIVTDKGSIAIACLNIKTPIIYLTDTTFQLMENFYPDYSNMISWGKHQGNMIERRAINNSWACIFRSQWAANSAINYYGASAKKIYVIHNGPNLEEHLIPDKTGGGMLRSCSSNNCNLLLIGYDWYRKGCDVAIKVTSRLREMEIDARLTICGCVPPNDFNCPEYVKCIPILDKNTLLGGEKLADLYQDSHFFIFPTRADAFGIVLIEATAFGLPILSSNVGGISELVSEGENGYLFSQNAQAMDYALCIAKIIGNPELYRKLSINAYKKYAKDFNWRMWANKMLQIMLEK